MSLLTYAAVQGNLRARLALLIDRETWARLMEPGRAAQVDAGPQVLRGRIAATTRALGRYLPRGARELLAWYNRRFEIENLKAVLRAVHYQLNPKLALASLVPLGSARAWEALVEAGSIGAVIEQLRESPYARPLNNAMERYQQEQRLFHLEIALDLLYFQNLVQLIESQSGKDGAGARRFLGRSIEVQNLLWAYRYRVYGHMTPEEIINYTLHRAFHAGLDTVRRVALGSPLAVEAGRLGLEIPSGLSEVEALTHVEFLAARELFVRATQAIQHPLFNLGGVLAYLWLLESEVRDLGVLAEGRAIGLSSAEIAKRMVRAA